MVSSYCRQYLLTIFSFLMIIECISLELLELRVPAYVVVGARAQLSCRWALSPADVLYSVKWYKDGKEFFRHVPRDSEPRRMFPLPGVHVEESDSSGSRLVLAGVQSETAGRYRCEVSGERPLFPTVSEHADMSVVVLPDHGPVISGLRTRYRHGDRVQVNCTSGQSRPACQLSWYINGEPALPTADLPPIQQVDGDGLGSTTLLLDFNLTEQHFTKNFIKVKFPLVPAEAITVHKSQGATMDKVVVHLSSNFKRSMLYVACSRARTSKGLFIVPCLATLASLYWQSNEESAELEKVKIHERLLRKVQESNSRADRVHTNFTCLQTTSSITFVGALLAILFAFKLCIYV